MSSPKVSISDVCLDAETPKNVYLSAKYKRSFAYHTVRDRLPVTVTQVVDHLSRHKEEIVQRYGEGCREEIKQVTGYLSKLKNELQTNKPLTLFTAHENDLVQWNDFLKKTEDDAGIPMFWFSDVWLYIECYLYRRIREGFALTNHLHDYDPFRLQKEDAFTGSLQAITVVGNHLLKLCTNIPTDKEKTVKQFLKLSLWGNRCDLSISGGKDIAQVDDPLEMISQLDSLILVNDLDQVCAHLTSVSSPSRIIDIVFDNSGYELFTDLCLAHLLMKFNLTDRIRFYAKRVPWFISDVMEHDFKWILQEMAGKTTIPCLPELSAEWQKFVSSGQWSVSAEPFWTLPFSYDSMQEIDPHLYSNLEQAKIVIFKGDLNYRKLVGDMNWVPTELFSVALRGFQPAPLVTLRTIKADVVVGLKEGLAEKTAIQDTDWLTSGKYAVVSFNKKN